jgi:RNA methyltransferase, TrmH family
VTDVVLVGFHAVKHALRFGAEMTELVAVDRTAALALAEELAPDLVDRLAADLVEVTPDRLRALAGSTAAGGVLGLARRPADVPPGPGRLVLLENPRHLGNVGAVVRVAAGLGAGAVLTTGTVDPWHPTVVRAAAGLHFAVPVRRVEELPPGPLVAFDPEGTDLRRTVLPGDAVLAFGSERHGLSGPLRAAADLVVAIPMRPGVSSYNLATSVAMALYAGNSSGAD